MRTISKTNLDGDKIAEPKISKTAHSANVRNGRKQDFSDNFNKNYCGDCGFRVRSKNHVEGAHHNGTVKPCHRGR